MHYKIHINTHSYVLKHNQAHVLFTLQEDIHKLATLCNICISSSSSFFFKADQSLHAVIGFSLQSFPPCASP